MDMSVLKEPAFFFQGKRWIPVFWNVTLCDWVSSSKHFKGTYCLSLQGSRGPWRL